MKQLIITVLLALVGQNSWGQDVHFSQYWNNGIQYNPGMAGVIPGNFRVATFYRDQWSSVNAKYNSYGVNFDARLETRGNTEFGLGVNIFRDVAGDVKLGNTHAQLAFSTILSLNRNSKLSIGVNGGLEQRGFDASGATWNSQYANGSYDGTMASGEAFNSTSEAKGDVSVGAVYYYTTNERYMTSNDQFNMKLGIAYNHILRPSFQWYNLSGDQLYSNLVAHAEFLIGIPNSKLALRPAVVTQFQGPSKEILLGTQFRIALKDASRITGFQRGAYLNLGTFLRVNDAFIPSVTFEYDMYSIGFSYDVNISQLRAASNGAGGFEISLALRPPTPFLWQGSRMSRSRYR